MKRRVACQRLDGSFNRTFLVLKQGALPQLRHELLRFNRTFLVLKRSKKSSSGFPTACGFNRTFLVLKPSP